MLGFSVLVRLCAGTVVDNFLAVYTIVAVRDDVK